MIRTPRPIFSQPFFISLVVIWLAIATAAVFYRSRHPNDGWILTAALPACLLEASFYLAATFEATRTWFASTFDRVQQSVALLLSGLLPYVIFSLPAHSFDSRRFLLLAILTSVFSLWYTLVPRRLPYDLGFLAIAAAPVIARVFRRIYISPDPAISVDVLGHLMWIRVGVVALLVLRPWNAGPFSLWPSRRDWISGSLWYAITLLPISGVALGIGDARLAPPPRDAIAIAAIVIGTFFGILWVVALSEELFFRGFILRALTNSGANPLLAIVCSAALFGSVHLWYRGFPNWRAAVVAGILGLGCGAAYQKTGSVRAPMVTHALTVMTYRLFFR